VSVPDFDGVTEGVRVPDLDGVTEGVSVPDLDGVTEDVTVPDVEGVTEGVSVPEFDGVPDPELVGVGEDVLLIVAFADAVKGWLMLPEPVRVAGRLDATALVEYE
jgi:hypothetical protein